MDYIEVEGHPGLVRDRKTGVILNTNEQQVEAARARKKAWKEKQKELDDAVAYEKEVTRKLDATMSQRPNEEGGTTFSIIFYT